MNMRLGGRRRGRDSGFQWLIIGIVLGMSCAFSFGLALYVFEIIEVTLDEEALQETRTTVITATPGPENTDPGTQPTGETPVVETTLSEPSPEQNETLEATGGQETPEPTPLPGGGDGGGQESGTSAPDTNLTQTPLPGGATATPTIGFSTDFNAQGSPEAALETTPIGLPDQPTLPPLLAAIRTPLVSVDGGVFRMGTTEDEGLAAVADCTNRDGGTCEESYFTDSIPPHDVQVGDFQIEMYEVSVGQYVAFLNSLVEQNPGTRPHLSACNGQPCALVVGDNGGQNSDIIYNAEAGRYAVRSEVVDRSNYPMTFVTWEGAKAYCQAIGRYLPTEAEWERAARGPQNTIYPWGPQWRTDDIANTARSGNNRAGTWVVDTNAAQGASAWGAANMAGNVAEWTNDYYSETTYAERAATGQVVVDPRGPNVGDRVVVRGGSWDTVPFFSRSVHRRAFAPGDANPVVGFRCAAEPSATSSAATDTTQQPGLDSGQ
ncbi:MAG: SUMF1/EgtB/PvdO family nonheme iron enzyme [Chloroflexi bacterium]|nr:SUMF1/EgtB/PvdO family nonheme iron enzyme [Chloroflexota bacterium]